jgi:hypothetical protein
MHASTQEHITTFQCAAALSMALRGACITQFAFFRTAWTITFTLSESSPVITAGLIEHPYELRIDAATNAESPVETDADIAKQLVLCTLLKITRVDISNENKDITFEFSDGTTISFPGVADPIDEVWTLYDPYQCNNTSHRAFGEHAFVQSYFGDLFVDQSFLRIGSIP